MMFGVRRIFAASVLMAGFFAVAAPRVQAAEAGVPAVDQAKTFIKWFEDTIRPMAIKRGLTYWTAAQTGKDADYAASEKASNVMDKALSDPKRFAEIKALKARVDAGDIKDLAIARQVDILYLTFLGKAVDPKLLAKINAKSTAAEKKYNVFRAKVGKKTLASSEVYDVLRKSTDQKELKATWEASKQVGRVVEKDLKELVALRNQAARKLGFGNYHQMALALDELNGKDLLALFDDLDLMTKDQFAQAKTEMDGLLAKRLGIKPEELMPWDYQNPFFQEAPKVLAADFDGPYKGQDVLKLASAFYRGIGLPIDDVIARSDMYERPGKNQEAFANDMDNAGDVRVLENVVNDSYWMDTSLHELGHSTYMSTYIPATLPYLLRVNSHTFTTEGLAMMMARQAYNPNWIEAMGLKMPDRKAFEDSSRTRQRWDLLVFSRWCQVMLRFEKSMYENPGQDLNKLWWDLVERYQLIKRPAGRNAPDYAAKSHIVSSPVYYHNYELGELYASQLREAIARETAPGKHGGDVVFVGDKHVGDFLKTKMYNLGALYRWDEQVLRTTGEKLNPKAFAEDLKK